MQGIQKLLGNAADLFADKGVTAYPRGGVHGNAQRVTYSELHNLAIDNSKLLHCLDGCSRGSIILLHFEDHLDNIIWIWSVLYAGCVPAMSTSLPKSPDHCKRHLHHLNHLLDHPVCLTRSVLQPMFPTETGLKIAHVEDLKAAGKDLSGDVAPVAAKTAGIALLMLTSGSTGKPKAVCLTHQQILASLSGKCAVLPVDAGSSFLNWIRLDHVGSLVEIHLHSMFAGTDQVHVEPRDFISEPSAFLKLIERHRVARTFAPNFFLSELGRFLESPAAANVSFDISSLRYIVSGGEAVVVETCMALSRILCRYGAPSNVIVPGFGMTETCAGSIYNLSFPDHDLKQQNEFACVGYCIPGLELRITSSSDQKKPSDPNPSDLNTLAGALGVGNLEIKGPIVFSKYYSDDSNSADAFTSDGWFKTGDTAFVDASGSLSLFGRTKDLVSINGVKYQPRDLDAALEDAAIEGMTPGHLTCFSNRAPGAQTEQLLVAYVPSYSDDDLKARYHTQNAISQTVLLVTGSRPAVLPLPNLERNAMGKISSSNLCKALHEGQYQAHQATNADLIATYEHSIYSPPANNLEQAILDVVVDVLGLPPTSVGVESDMFEMGLSSITMIKLQHRLQEQLKLNQELPLAMIMTYSTIRSLAEALTHRNTYIPVVTLRSHGTKTPLWLIHPAAGESMVFLNLAKLITDRPVYGLRARGFVAGEQYFSSLEECVSIYYSGIKAKQPQGPYAIAGYSYGGMLAFELGKRLEHNGDEVRFLATVNRPPRVHPRLRGVQWADCLVNLAYFVEVISEDAFHVLLKELQGSVAKANALARVMGMADQSRLLALGLDGPKLENWANVTLSLQDLARDYQPHGSVEHMDVLYCDPLEMVGASREEWLKRLREWQEFSREGMKYYELRGKHHNVLAPEHVRWFHKMIVKAMAARDA